MLAFLIPFVLANPQSPKCDAIDACIKQADGTMPLIKFIPTLADGGTSYSFSTIDCNYGLLALNSPCMCGGEMKFPNNPSQPGYCFEASGDATNKHSLWKDDFAFCKNQFGLTKNTFWGMNEPELAQCWCFDPKTGIHDIAHVGKPMCSNGFAYYEDCSIDGDDANEALLAPYTGDVAKAISFLFPHTGQQERHPACQCGEYGVCRAPTTEMPYFAPYCQYLVGVCTRVKECGILGWKSEDVFDDDGCACGEKTCMHDEVCDWNEKDGEYEYFCTWQGKSSSPGSIVKMSLAMAELGYSFSITVFVCSFFACIMACLTYCKAKKL